MRLPAFEKAVSQVLLNIKVGRRCVIQHINWVTVRLRVLYMCRKFMPKVMVSQYEQQLQQLITTLSDYRGRRNYPKVWPTDLSTYEIVIETLVLSNYYIYIWHIYIYLCSLTFFKIKFVFFGILFPWSKFSSFEMLIYI